MHRLSLILVCALWLSLLRIAPASGQEQVAQHYVIDATLDARNHTLHGHLTLTLLNRSSTALNELVFHLYLNAFRDEHSVFMRESGGMLRSEHASGRGKIVLTALRVADVEHLTGAQNELIPRDFTQLRVPLKTPLKPGASTAIDIEFDTTFPPLFARSGWVGDLIIAGQWFPKLAKLESDGTYVSFPYHALGEFYADFADYDVTLRLPQRHRLVSTGAVVNHEFKGSQQTVRMRAQRVHDFAWVASPSLELTRRRMHDVDVTFLAPSSYDRALAEHMFVVDKGLAYFGKLYGKYPYPTLAVVVPPRGADGGAGMEYPTLIVTDGTWLPTPLAPSLSGAIVTAHELAHQWFYGLLASNEVRYPVLDEGLSEWATLDLLRALYGPRDTLAGWTRLDRFEWASVLLRELPVTPAGQAAYDYTTAEYGASVYGRASLVLETIRRAYGDARFRKALALYSAHNRFEHPGPGHLLSAFDEVYGDHFGQRVLGPLLLDGLESALSISSAKQTKEANGYRIEVHVQRKGVALPAWLRAYDVQGRELAAAPLRASDASVTLTLTTPGKAARVILDSERNLLLDNDARDQTWVFQREPARNVAGRLLAVAQTLLSWVGP